MRSAILLSVLAGVAAAQNSAYFGVCDQTGAPHCIKYKLPAGALAGDELVQGYSLAEQGIHVSGKTISALYGSTAMGLNLWYDPAYDSAYITVYGSAGTPMPLNVNLGLLGGYVIAPGFVSSVPGGSWQGFNSATDGIAARGVAIAENVAGTAGGALDFGAVTISPNSGRTCMDVWGNVVSIPVPLPGLPANLWTAGTYSDVPMWNSTSPMQGYLDPYSGLVNTSGTSVSLVSGGGFRTGTYWDGYPIFINGVSYIVSSVGSSSALTLQTSAGTQTSVPYYEPFSVAGWGAGVYPIGQTPCNGGPIVPSGAPNGINSSSYFASLYGFAAMTHGAYNSFQSYSDGRYPAGGVVAGQILATTIYPGGTVTRTGTLTVPTALGGILYLYPADQDPSAGTIATVDNPLLPGYGSPGEGMLATRSDLHCLRYYNASTSTWSCIGGGSGVSSITGTANEVLANGNSGTAQTGAITLTLPQDIGTGSNPTFASLTATGVIQSTASGTAIAFQTGSPYNFQVNGNGVVSAQQYLASNTTNTGATLLAVGYGSGSSYTWPFTVTTAGNVVLNNLTINGTCTGCGGGGGYWDLSSGLLYPASTSDQVLIGQTSGDGSGAALQIEGRLVGSQYLGINSSGVVQIYPLAGYNTQIVFQTKTVGGTYVATQMDAQGNISTGCPTGISATCGVIAANNLALAATSSWSVPYTSYGGLGFSSGATWEFWIPEGSGIYGAGGWGPWSPEGASNQCVGSACLGGSPALNTVYRNTHSTTMLVTATVYSTCCTIYGLTDSSSTPSTTVAAIEPQAAISSGFPMSFNVLPGNYYELQSTLTTNSAITGLAEWW